MEILPLTANIAKQAGALRVKYQEKIPWGDCLIAATAIENEAESIVTEDPHYSQIKEIRARRTLQL